MNTIKKCLILPDSFKGSLSAMEQCEIAKSKVLEFFPECKTITIPVADGGEGTVDCFLHALGGEKVNVAVSGPYLKKIDTYYGRFGSMAVIEMAAAAGLPMVNNKNPALTTTLGVGEIMRHAVENGAKKIVLGMGGSCTNDGGCGCAVGMGVKFFDKKGNEFLPTGNTLEKIVRIDRSEAHELLKDVELTAMCDISNVLYGPQGAAYIYGPQKGADSEMLKILDRNLKALGDLIEQFPEKIDYANFSGAGAAGGLGTGVAAFLGAKLNSGIETVLDLVGFEDKLKGADLVITGEGRIDAQSLQGKVVIGVAMRAKKLNVPVIAVVGEIADDADCAYDFGVTAMFTTNRKALPFAQAKLSTYKNYGATIEDILRTIKCFKNY